jgi:hypothetical protein
MEENKNSNDLNINTSEDIKVTDSGISIIVNKKDGQQREYTFPESTPSDVIALSTSVSTAAEMSVNVFPSWQEKIENEIDDIKKLRLEEVEVNFGIIKFKLKRS